MSIFSLFHKDKSTPTSTEEGQGGGSALLLAYYSLFETHNITTNDILERLENVCNFTRGRILDQLVMDDDLIRRGYDYKFGENLYAASPKVMAKTILWLYDTEEGHRVLDTLKPLFTHYSMGQNMLQMIITDYVRSKYTDTLKVRNVMKADIPYLIPVIDDHHFENFILRLPDDIFVELLKESFSDAFTFARMLDTDVLEHVISNHTFQNKEDGYTLQSMLALYEYMAYGKVARDKKLFTKIPETCLLSAIYESYHGLYDAAIQDFKEAQRLYNARISAIEKRGIFPYSIINILLVLTYAHKADEESLHQLDIMIKRKDIEPVETARLIARVMKQSINSTITQSSGLDNELAEEMRRMKVQGNTMTSYWITIIERYLSESGDAATETIAPPATWALLRHEMGFAANDTFDAFGKNPLLMSVYRQAPWESAINALLSKLNKSYGAQSGQHERTERIAYYIEDIYDSLVTVKLQSVTKAGGWSIGKTIPFHQFMTMPTRQLMPSDLIIRDRNQNIGYMNGYKLTLASILPEMTEQSRLYVGRFSPYYLVTVTEEVPYLMVEPIADGFEVKSNVRLEQIDEDIIIVSRGTSSINFLRMNNDIRPFFSQLLNIRYFPHSAEEKLSLLLTTLGRRVEIHSPLIPGGTTLETIEGTSKLTFQIRPHGKEGYDCSLFCRPLPEGRVQCRPGEGSEIIIDQKDGKRYCVKRNLEAEKAILTPFLPGEERAGVVDAYTLLPIIDYVREHPDQIELEWPEGKKLSIRRRVNASQWHATLKKNANGWFELEGTLQIDDDTMLSMQQLMSLITSSKGSRYIKLGDGEFLALSEKLRQQLSAIDALATRSRGHVQMSAFTAALLDRDITEGEIHIDTDDELRQIRQRIIDLSDYHPEVPSTLNAHLRSYQREGYEWLVRLNEWGAGALLADDMGLGKTVQAIAYLLHKAAEGPQLVIAPASVAPNWKVEFEKFAPSLHVEILNFATNRSTCIANAGPGDVIITTYNLLLSVKQEITQKEWLTAVLDEAHVIKNRGAKTSGVCMKLQARNRIMMTGTPVQNHLGELWNLFQFVNPGLLGSYEDYGRRFITPIETANNKERRAQLERIVKPFMLRRTKDKVLSELPEKTEIYQLVNMSVEELAVYEDIRTTAEQMLLAEENEDHVSLNTLAEITRLRQAACASSLVDKTMTGRPSKVTALIEALEPIIDSGDSALVFSQFTSFLSIVKDALDDAHIPYLYIDGSVPVKEREKLVEKFQSTDPPPCPLPSEGGGVDSDIQINLSVDSSLKAEYSLPLPPNGRGQGGGSVFLISLKAGGLGLNLTRANYVFHLDPWWNPAIEQQATDRAYRIGQHRAVTVYHLLAANTIEEKIRRMHERKRDLSESILEGTDASVRMTGKELLELVK